VDYTSMKEKLLQSWRYKTLAVIKRNKNHLSFNNDCRQVTTMTTKL